jgi:Carboxypeptidase regulatory-like domain
MRKHCFIAGAVALLSLAFAYGKIAEGVLDGVVLNGRGVPVAFAEVFWQAADGKAPHATRANGKGRFRIAGVSQGLYDLRAQASGMTSEWEHNVLVRSGKVSSVTLHLIRPKSSISSRDTH